MTNQLEIGDLENSKRLVIDYAEQAATEDERKLSEQEIEIMAKLVEIAYQTEIPAFGVIEVGSVKNEVVQKKLAEISKNLQINEKLFPPVLVKDFPVEFTDSTKLEKAPWVNMVHAWTLVLNWMNAIHGMQDENVLNPGDIVTISRRFRDFTTESDSKVKRLRTSSDFLAGKEYEESRHRRRGVKNVNAQRYVCHAEMMYILNTLFEAYKR